ncbi:MAG: hypothetical protein ACRC0G_17960 [Fusobacteriaceae bacterium]
MDYRDILSGDSDKIEELLVKLGFTEVTYSGKKFRFGLEEGGSSTRFSFSTELMKFMDFRDGESGDLIDLIKLKKGVSTYRAINWLQLSLSKDVSLSGKLDNSLKKTNKIIDDMGADSEELPVFPNSSLDEYENGYYNLFLNDGVGAYAHIMFDIRFDPSANRILIPVRNEDGFLVGIIGRYNSKSVPTGMAKYLPTIAYQKKKVLYGAWENRNYLSEVVYIVESEKTVQQAFSMGYRNVVAIGGNTISTDQLSVLRSFNPSKVIILLDKGLRDRGIKNHYLEQASKAISKNPFLKYVVGFMDSNNVDELPDKCNPFDLDKATCAKLLKNNIEYIGGL